ncbi:SH3 domain-containing protein [Desulfogranum mediterraneum]|uniref:SH3 domain-containing protein n=1 Tax=Desulfogranum mediterraneum TaxID=160661 RepID=UPI00129474FC|nr:SH3 domain-containing protein [Desulfogranum mediterraneum]
MKRKHTLILLVLFLSLLFTVDSALAAMVAIKGDDINMRSGPGTKYKVLWKLDSGFPLKILKKKGSWYRVQDFEGTIGWVHRNVTTRKGHMIVDVNKKSQKRVNVRSGPGTNNRIVAKAYYGVVFRTLKQKSGWVQVEHEKGVRGWIKRSLVWGF